MAASSYLLARNQKKVGKVAAVLTQLISIQLKIKMFYRTKSIKVNITMIRKNKKETVRTSFLLMITTTVWFNKRKSLKLQKLSLLRNERKIFLKHQNASKAATISNQSLWFRRSNSLGIKTIRMKLSTQNKNWSLTTGANHPRLTSTTLTKTMRCRCRCGT